MQTLPRLLVALSVLAAALGCGPGGEVALVEELRPVTAAATVEPLGYLLERVGGERVRVKVLIPNGRSPHDFEPSPNVLSTLSSADLLLIVGHPSFAFEQRLIEPLNAAGPEDAAERTVSVMEIAGVDAFGLEDPHPWLAPPVLAALAEALGERLAAIDPQGAEGYARRAAELAAESRALDTELTQLLVASPCRAFLVDHPAWGIFARHYGLVQLALEHEGKEPGPATLTRLIERARVARIQLVLVRPGHEAIARSLAAALDAEIEVLDPLTRDVPAALRRAADLVQRSCRP